MKLSRSKLLQIIREETVNEVGLVDFYRYLNNPLRTPQADMAKKAAIRVGRSAAQIPPGGSFVTDKWDMTQESGIEDIERRNRTNLAAAAELIELGFPPLKAVQTVAALADVDDPVQWAGKEFSRADVLGKLKSMLGGAGAYLARANKEKAIAAERTADYQKQREDALAQAWPESEPAWREDIELPYEISDEPEETTAAQPEPEAIAAVFSPKEEPAEYRSPRRRTGMAFREGLDKNTLTRWQKIIKS
jgi:hypothetical protein